MTEWEETTLGKICEDSGGNIQTGPFGSQLHASAYVPVGVPSIMPQNIGDNRVMINGIARITDADARRLSRYLVKSGDIVHSRRGDVERRALIRETEDGWLCGTGCLRVRFGDKRPISSTFISYYLDAPNIRMWIVQHAVGATMPNLNTAILSDVPVRLPPYHEQKTIADVLSALDDKIELNRHMNQTLETTAQALFKSWFVDFDPTGCATRLKGENVASSSPGLASTHRIERRPLSTAQGCKDVTGSIIQRAKCHNARIYVAADRNTNILELNRQPFFRRRISPQKQL
jgi:type I restriction enzyme S subunit